MLMYYSRQSALFALLFFSILLISGSTWLDRKFAISGIDQIFMSLSHTNSAPINPTLLISAIKNFLVIPLFIASLLSYILMRKKSHLLLYIFIFISSIAYALNEVHAFDSIYSLKYNHFYETHYSNSPILAKNKTKNLILIYVESLEKTYSNKSIFKTNLLQPLDDLAQDKNVFTESFNDFKQSFGANYTIAGIISSQCGLPLKLLKLSNNESFLHDHSTLLPGATCLGNVLKQYGYSNIFMGGASTDFAGKGSFLKQHGYDEVIGLDDWKKKNYSNFNEWGLYDDDLFKEAREKLTQLETQHKPFNLTLLTVDTHMPNGFYSKYCREHGAKKFEDIVSCTAQQLANFVNYAKQKGYLDNTNIIITGDHLSMPNIVYDQLQQEKERHIYNLFISQTPITKNRDTFVHLDMLPTILEFQGFSLQNGRFALGQSGLCHCDISYTANRNIDLDFKLKASSMVYNQFSVVHKFKTSSQKP